MKKVLLSMVCALALTSCRLDLSGLHSNHVEPSEKIVCETYKLKPFEEVAMNYVGNVELIQNEQKSGTVELTAPDNYIELFKFESDGSQLSINASKNNVSMNSKDVRIKIYVADLVKIKNGGASNITMDSLDTDRLEIHNSGVGHIKVTGIADDVDLKNSGVGNIEADNLKALNAKASVSGVGSITCYASEKIEGHVSGVGSLTYKGHPKQKDTHRSGVGSITEK